MDLKACAAVREAVGPDIHLMIDAFHWYSRTEALELGRGLEKLGFAWIEEPLDEQSMSTYAWLAENLDIPVLGPESAAGKHFARAEWIKAGACDILRTGVHDVGGITPALKSMRLAESFGMNCEVHGNGGGEPDRHRRLEELPLVRARAAAPVPRVRRRVRLPEPARRSDGRGRVRASVGPAGARARHQLRLHQRQSRRLRRRFLERTDS